MTMNPESSNAEDTINLLDYWRVLVRYRRLIVLTTGAAFVLSVIVSLLLPRIYAATSSILPPAKEALFDSGILSRFAAGGLGADFLGQGLGPNELWVGILKSQTVRDAIIDRFDLRQLYGAKTIEVTRRALDRVVTIDKSPTEGIVSVTVEDRDRKRAADMANAFMEELDKINREVVVTSGKRMRVFLEARLGEAKGEQVTIEEAVRAFQEEHQAVQLDKQSTEIIEAIGAIEGQLMAKRVELQTFLSYATRTNPRAEILQTEVKELKERLKELQEGIPDADNPSSGGIFIPTANLPALAMEYTRLLRDAKMQETLIELLTLQYEMARIQEAKDSPTIQLLDVAKPPEKKIKPKRAVIVLGSTFFAAAVSILIAFLLVYIERVRMQDTKLGSASKTPGA